MTDVEKVADRHATDLVDMRAREAEQRLRAGAGGTEDQEVSPVRPACVLLMTPYSGWLIGAVVTVTVTVEGSWSS